MNQFAIKKLAAVMLTIAVLTAVDFGQVSRLRVFVEGKELSVQAEQRGTQILVPVASIAESFGYLIDIDVSSEEVRVKRGAVEAQFIKRNSEVRENGITTVNIPNGGEIIFPTSGESLLLPSEVISALLNVSVFAETNQLLVRIERRASVVSSAVSQQKGFNFSALDYIYDTTSSNGSFSQTLNLASAGTFGGNVFQANLSFSGGSGGSPINFQRGSLTVRRKQGDRFQFGDLDFRLGPGLSFINTFVRGAAYESATKIFGREAEYSVFGGRAFNGVVELDFTSGDTARRRFRQLDLNTTVYGGRIAFNPARAANRLIQTNKFTYSLGAIGFNGVGLKGQMVETSIGFTSTKLNFQADIGAGNFDVLRSDSNRRSKGFGVGLAVNGSYTPWSFLSLQGRFEKFSPKFSGPQRTGQYSNRASESVGFIMRPFSRLTFGANFANYKYTAFNRRSENLITTKSFSYNAAYDPSAKFLPRISFSATTIRNPLFGEISTMRIGLAREIKNFRPFLSYAQTSRSNGGGNKNITAGSNFSAGSFGLFQAQGNFSFGKNQVSSDIEKCFLASGQTNANLCPQTPLYRYGLDNSSLSVDWYAKRPIYKGLQMSVGGGYISDRDRKQFVFRSTSTMPLPFGQNLQFSYYNAGYGHEFRIGLSGSLAFWRKKESRGVSINEEEFSTESIIRGRVYIDENFNRTFDAGIDKPLGNVRVQLNNGRVSISDASGGYSFDRVEPGKHQLEINIKDIRADLIPSGGVGQSLVIQPLTTVDSSFRLVRSGSLSGRIWHDKNENGVFDTGEGLADVRVVSGSGSDTFTDIDGTYLLGELPPGEQVVFIDERYTPEVLAATVLKKIAEVKPGQETKDVFFVFKTKSQKVQEKNFESSH